MLWEPDPVRAATEWDFAEYAWEEACYGGMRTESKAEGCGPTLQLQGSKHCDNATRFVHLLRCGGSSRV